MPEHLKISTDPHFGCRRMDETGKFASLHCTCENALSALLVSCLATLQSFASVVSWRSASAGNLASAAALAASAELCEGRQGSGWAKVSHLLPSWREVIYETACVIDAGLGLEVLRERPALD